MHLCTNTHTLLHWHNRGGDGLFEWVREGKEYLLGALSPPLLPPPLPHPFIIVVISTKNTTINHISNTRGGGSSDDGEKDGENEL